MFVLEFYGLLITDKVMSSWPVNLLAFFLGRLSPLSGWPVLVHILSPVTDNALLESAGGRFLEGVNDHGNDFMINLHGSYVAYLAFELVTLDLQSDMLWTPLLTMPSFSINQGPVVQSVVTLMSSLRVISLTVLADSIYNIIIFFAEKMWVAFALQKLLTFFQQKNSAYLHITWCKF